MQLKRESKRQTEKEQALENRLRKIKRDLEMYKKQT